MTTSAQPPPGLTVDGYAIIRRLGEGGMGVVHLARRPGGQPVALKVLRPHIVGDDEARRRLEREVGSLSRIHSPWVAEIVDSDPWGEVPYVATRYVPGLSLHEVVAEDGPLQGADLRRLAHGLAEGIASVHEVGVLHRDVKPSNVLMEGRTPILIDFGLARVADDPRLTHTGWLLGTPGYLAPEILQGEDASEASDLHSWAATVAYAGTGRAPFGRGPSMAIMDRVRRGDHDLTGLPAPLQDVLGAALDPDPANRPAMPELLAWLRDPRGAVLPVGPGADEHTVALAPAPDDLHEEPSRTRLLDPHGWDPDGVDADDPWADPEPARVPLVERARRGLLLLSLATVVGAAVTAYPWPTAAVLLVLTWLLRGMSLAASATDERRQLRGARWYDPVLYLLGAPWHAVRAIPGALLLALWSAGLGVAGALVCYALATPVETMLLVAGLTFSAAVWVGPGGSRVRGPVGRVVRPVSRGTAGWLVALALLLGAAVLLGLRVEANGVDWTPDDGPPLSDVRLRVPWELRP
ncbi:serine/threonine-protein kinase [Nocardioides sp. GCM10027113]|uniref:serine/threonine-protein kinase n=1 Tax=unclassified Nocardioides TaxID=2615069 RepID=UPI00360FA212